MPIVTMQSIATAQKKEASYLKRVTIATSVVLGMIGAFAVLHNKNDSLEPMMIRFPTRNRNEDLVFDHRVATFLKGHGDDDGNGNDGNVQETSAPSSSPTSSPTRDPSILYSRRPFDVDKGDSPLFPVEATGYTTITCTAEATSGGDIDLSLFWDGQKCLSETPGTSTEECTLHFGTVERFYVGVQGNMDTTGVTVTCKGSNPPVTTLTSGSPSQPLTVGADSVLYTLSAGGFTTVSCQVQETTGDAFLTMHWDDRRCAGNECTLNFGNDPSVDLEVYARQSVAPTATGASVTCTTSSPPITPLTSGVSSDPFNMTQGDYVLFSLGTNSSFASVTCTTESVDNNGDADIVVTWDTQSCYSYLGGSAEGCTVDGGSGDVLVEVRGGGGEPNTTDVTLTCTGADASASPLRLPGQDAAGFWDKVSGIF